MESKSKSKSSSSRHRRRSDSSEERSYKHSSKRKNYSSNESSDSDHDDRKRHRDKKEKKSSSSKQTKTDDSPGGGGAENLSLSIEETNKLRAKLGLKPLSLDESSKEKPKQDETGKKTFIDKDTNQEFEHAPAKNLAEAREQKEFKQKLEEQREKRRLAEKMKQVKSIADEESDSDSESADAWVRKLKEKQEAAKKAKLLEELDEQLMSQNEVTQKTKKYNASNLKGLRVEHDQTKFKEGEEIILTLKDRNIVKGLGENLELDEEDDADVLVNVNLLDDERAIKNLENKKKKPDYNPYDDFDEDGNFKVKSILTKYDEELNGEEKKSFRLGAKGVYDASDDKFIKKLDDEHKARAIKLDILTELKEASDYMTTQEMEKFKKPKKIRKVLRKNKNLKADDLLPLPNETQEVKTRSVKVEKTDKKPKDSDTKKVDLDNIDFDFIKKNESSSDEGEIRSTDDESDIDISNIGKFDDIQDILDQENELREELHIVLDKTRKKITSSILNQIEVREEVVNDNSQTVVNFDNLKTVEEMDEDKTTLTMDTISEFCRGIGTDTKVENEEMELSYTRKNEEKVESEDEELEDEEFNLSDVEAEVENEKNREEMNVLDEEPIIDRGIGSALKLAVNKGYLGKEKDNLNARAAKSDIQAKNYTIEERNYYDIDDKYNRNRDKFSGPLVDFEEKRGYKPDIKLDYFDEKGHAMNEKEAFRYLSHRFHGKGPGKKKTEKRLNKFKEAEAMNKMSSSDTPLHTVELLIEKQKRLQQPYVVLSAQKGKQDQVTLHKR
ncbi:unnamed protein product [Brachionus calyciflorus]|uniref:U4/U6.U5 tri-snRNP-associated protein 1 n=1 Tax=Brachionus calyciflorus TaxID=104777 RepID=A0A813VJW2_9BILA|nr:unnamed protein product [Brachionus calyciflorus]